MFIVSLTFECMHRYAAQENYYATYTSGIKAPHTQLAFFRWFQGAIADWPLYMSFTMCIIALSNLFCVAGNSRCARCFAEQTRKVTSEENSQDARRGCVCDCFHSPWRHCSLLCRRNRFCERGKYTRRSTNRGELIFYLSDMYIFEHCVFF